jgi:AraC-like DNA-binding protein
MVNTHRIARARQMLADPALRSRPILLIALDCGFGSIGPFNRAFKAGVGVTPRAFRGANLRDS